MTASRVVKTPSRLAQTSTHKAWQWMMGRCFTKTQSTYANYGARGITVCARWLSYENFLEDMGLRPPGTSLDRKDNNGNYEPSNCRWATVDQQNANKRTSFFLTFNGQTMTAAQWERKVGFPYGLVWRRVKRLGWTSEKAITTPLQIRCSHGSR